MDFNKCQEMQSKCVESAKDYSFEKMAEIIYSELRIYVKNNEK